MDKSTCEGKFHMPFRKSRRLRSLVRLYSSDSASERAHEHQNPLLFNLSGLIHSRISFSWQEVPTGSCWLLMESKGQVPVYENCFIHIPGDGTWGFTHPSSPAFMNYWVNTWLFSVISSTGGIEAGSICIQKVSHQPSCSGWN